MPTLCSEAISIQLHQVLLWAPTPGVMTFVMHADAPEVAPLPALVNGFVTFASFNNMAKITPQVSSGQIRLVAHMQCRQTVIEPF